MNITNIIVKIIDKFENNRNLIEEFTAVGAPKLIYNGADDKYQPIMASEFQFNLMVNDKTDGKYFHLYTGNEKRYLVTVEDQNENLLFEGYLLPDFYSEPFDNGVIFVDLTATDGIGLLKGNFLPNQFYKQETSVIKLIAECLRFTKLNKNISFAPAIQSAATDYRWDEIAINGACYLDGEIEVLLLAGEVMPKRKNAYEILELLLNSIGCTLYGQGNTWFIEGINRKHEESQLVYNYTENGSFIATETLTKDVLDLVFFKTPIVSIVSPWKTVEIDWDIDEEGELIPQYAIQDNTTGNLFAVSSIKDMFSFWKINGALSFSSLNVESKLRYILTAYLGLSFIEGFVKPLHLQVLRLLNYGSTPEQSENETEFVNNYFSILKRKYLKISDEYIDRLIEFKISLESTSRYTGGGTPVINAIDEKEFSRSYKYELLCGTNIIVSSKLPESNDKCHRLTAKKVSATSDYNSLIVAGDYYTAKPETVAADLELKELTFDQNGFFDIKLHAPLSSDHTQPWFYNYVVKSLSIKISELKKWEHTLKRNIDFSTKTSVSIFHGDSIADLTEKQFRFRRYVLPPDNLPGEVEIISSYIDAPGIITTWNFIVSYESAQLILANPSLFTFNFEMPTGPKTMNEIYGTTDNYGLLWNVAEISGLWVVAMVVPIGNPYFTAIEDFNDAFVDLDNSDVVYGLLNEDNEWRESWKRYGQTEDIRYGIALGKIYNDVQPKALVKIEGSASGCVFPRELGRFLWRDVKKFIPTRTKIDFTTGRSEVLLLENLHQIVTDYVD
jgi:hypothetical protein